MFSNFNPNIDLVGSIEKSKLDTGADDMQSVRMGDINQPSGPSFKNVMSDMVGNLNQQVNAPDQLLKDVMMGDDSVDIHDVMTAMAKAELSVNVATQITGKVIQAYDKIMQIQL